MIKGIIFDFDGVIVDSETQRFLDVKSILNHTEYQIKEEHINLARGKKTPEFLKELYPDIPEDFTTELMIKRRELQKQNIKKNKLIPGIKDLLKELKARDIKIGICTGSSRIFVDKILAINQINNYFNIIVTGDEFKSSKPNPECYQLAIRKINIPKQDLIVIEDSVAGILSAKNANLKVIGIKTYETEEKMIKADYIYNDHTEILKNIEKILN